MQNKGILSSIEFQTGLDSFGRRNTRRELWFRVFARLWNQCPLLQSQMVWHSNPCLCYLASFNKLTAVTSSVAISENLKISFLPCTSGMKAQYLSFLFFKQNGRTGFKSFWKWKFPRSAFKWKRTYCYLWIDTKQFKNKVFCRWCDVEDRCKVSRSSQHLMLSFRKLLSDVFQSPLIK